MRKNLVNLLLTAVFTTAFLLSCSSHDGDGPYQPPVQIRGKIAIVNESAVMIRIVGYTQQRGDTTVSMSLGVHLFANQNYYLQNLIEPDMGQMFPGGDIIRVSYVADAPDPDDPTQPLFRNTVELTVNGTYFIQVKNGGIYSISPGSE
jgi:hypothetical protein